VPLALERRGLLPLRPAPARLGLAGGRGGAQPADLRAEPIPLSLATGAAQRAEQCPGGDLGFPLCPDPLGIAGRAIPDRGRPIARLRPDLVVLSDLLLDRLMGGHTDAAPQESPEAARGTPAAAVTIGIPPPPVM